MDGIALFESLKKKNPALPVIILTAHGTIPGRRRGHPARCLRLHHQALRRQGPAHPGAEGPAVRRQPCGRQRRQRGDLLAGGDHHAQPGDGGDPGQGAPGRRQRRQRDDLRRERHRQGADGARHSPGQRPRRPAFRRGQLRCHPGAAARVGAVRARQGCVHRRRVRLQGAVPSGRPRHRVPRRDRRHAAAAAGQAAARAAGEGGTTHRLDPGDQGGRAHHLGHAPQSRGRHQDRRVPRGSVLPPARRSAVASHLCPPGARTYPCSPRISSTPWASATARP